MSKIIDSISEIVSLYDVFILDQWGVMHDGHYGYDQAIESVEKIIKENKKLIIISNSSKRKASSIGRLKSLGFDKNHFIEVMTSGEMIWQEISTSIENYGNNLNKCFHIYDSSKEDGLEFRNGLEKFNYGSKINDANFILACTPFENTQPIDYILHFASPASPIDYLKYPLKTLRIGSVGTENILNLALKKKSIILVASTSEIYGDPLEHPQSESYFGNVNPIGPRGVYDEAKRYLEAMTMAYKRKKKLNIRIVRIFNTYGPRMRINDGRAIPNFINQSMNRKKYTLYGDGNQTRSFCYVSDTTDAIFKLLFSNYNNPVNIGNPDEYTLNQLLKLINQINNYTNEIIFKKLPENDPKRRKPDISLAKKILNWEPKISLRDGLIKTIDYYNNLNKE